MSKLMTNGKDCWEDIPCKECGEPVRVIYPDSFKMTYQGGWPEVKVVCPECASFLEIPEHVIPYDKAFRHVVEGPKQQGRWEQFDFETGQYKPIEGW